MCVGRFEGCVGDGAVFVWEGVPGSGCFDSGVRGCAVVRDIQGVVECKAGRIIVDFRSVCKMIVMLRAVDIYGGVNEWVDGYTGAERVELVDVKDVVFMH